MTDLVGGLIRSAGEWVPWVGGAVCVGVGGWLLWSSGQDLAQARRDRDAATAAEEARAAAVRDSTIPDAAVDAIEQVSTLLEQADSFHTHPAWSAAWGTTLWLLGMAPDYVLGSPWFNQFMTGSTRLAYLLGELAHAAATEGSYFGPAFGYARDDMIQRTLEVSNLVERPLSVPPVGGGGGGGAGKWLGALVWLIGCACMHRTSLPPDSLAVLPPAHPPATPAPISPPSAPPAPIELLDRLDPGVEVVSSTGGWMGPALAAILVVVVVYWRQRRRGR